MTNAGIAAPQVWNAISPKDFGNVMDINVTGTWNTVMAGAQKIIDGGRGGSITWVAEPRTDRRHGVLAGQRRKRNVTAARISVDQGSTQY
ncbi:NAD(P)-dependent dehydrogenase (short-subunit alcohol dehydrogenase family) [Mycobacterium sp. URHB0021]